MGYVVALLWICALTLAALVLVIIYEATHPDADLESLRRHEAERAASKRAHQSPMTLQIRAASSSGGGSVPTREPGRAQPPGRTAPWPTPSRQSGGVGQLASRDTAAPVSERRGI